MLVPSFIDPPLESTPEASRRLIGLSEIDVTRDVLSFTYQFNDNVDDIDPSKNDSFKYYLDITQWNEEGLDIQMNFT